ncbi:Rpn family recombination-promoting nuclease/putative transposase, partial [Romboutsia ilealis]|uniref:Rpn family recombination-promoting nuclease/putative transposase n=3 Tax=Peptostreptococcaceae TaxID=186804 RepID=UPI002F429550
MRRTLLNPKIDFVFKKIFGSEEHPEILISFLNAVLKPQKPIVSVEIKNSDLEKEYIEDKFSRLDVKALTSNKEIINIEIQLKNEYNMIQRSLYYWSKLYEEQLSEGDRYDKLSRTVCINILDFKYLKNDRFHNGYRLKEIETNEELTDLQEIHFIEIPK